MKKQLNSYFFFLATFLLLVLFFSQIHPLLPFDSDDWTFMSANRIALPSPRYWNPSRVLPEVLMPFFSGLAAYTIYPITGDYIEAMVTMHALVVSFFITLYVYFFVRLLRNRLNVSPNLSLLYALLFLSLHFLIFRTADSDNRHLFYSHDLTCYYFYIIPNMLNAILVMSLLEHDWIKSNKFSFLKKGLVAVTVYLAICSNLYCSVIFVVFIICRLLMAFPWSRISFYQLRNFSFQNWPSLAIILLWLCVNLMELMGPRSAFLADTGVKAGLFTQIGAVVQMMMLWRVNMIFAGIVVLAAIYGVKYSYSKKTVSRNVIILLFSSVLTLIYAILVTSKVQADYILRTDIAFSVVFPVLLLTLASVVKASQEYKHIIIAMPMLLLLVFSNINRSEPAFRDLRCNESCTIEKLRRIDNDLISQIKKADCLPQSDSVFVTVPFVADDGHNWPYLVLNNNGYNSLSHTLYKHGLIQRLRPGKFVMGKPFEEY